MTNDIKPEFDAGGQHIADRILSNQKVQEGSVYLRGEAAPTPQQVAAVLHALADHSLIMHMLSDDVKHLGADNAELGGKWEQATGIGRWFQGLGDALDFRK
jgi:hypothetical protein